MAKKSIFITGDKSLDRKLGRLQKRVQSKIVYAGLRKGGPIVARAIKNALPSRYKGARKSIGWRFRSRRKSPKGIAQVTAGAAVGKKKLSPSTIRKRAAAVRERSSKPGVGIGARNIHWLLLGTDSRRQTSTGRSTGIMPGLRTLVQSAFASVASRVKQSMIARIREGIEKEARKR